MDERTKTLLVSAFVLIVILAIIFGIIFSVIRIIQNRRTATNASPSPSALVLQNSPGPTSQPIIQDGQSVSPIVTPVPRPSGDFDTYNKGGISFNYPRSWGILSCSNSQNLELDPLNNTDQLNFACDIALKPITILVGSSNCPAGETGSKGGVNFTKSQISTPTGVNYAWCTQTSPSLEITHRVSRDGSRATSTRDFSAEIENLISTIRTGTAI